MQLYSIGAQQKNPTQRKSKRSKNVVPRRLSNVPPYVSNLTLHNDFYMKTINEEAQYSFTHTFTSDFYPIRILL